MTAIALQVQLDYDIVRSGEQAWWTTGVPRHHQQITRDIEWLLLTAGLALVMIVGFVGLLARAAQRRDVELTQRDSDLARVAAANEFEARLQRALELPATEDRVFGVVEQALEEAVPPGPERGNAARGLKPGALLATCDDRTGRNPLVLGRGANQLPSRANAARS